MCLNKPLILLARIGIVTIEPKSGKVIMQNASFESFLIFPVPIKAVKLVAFFFDRFSWFPVTRDQLTMLMQGNTVSEQHFTEFDITPKSFSAENLGYLKAWIESSIFFPSTKYSLFVIIAGLRPLLWSFKYAKEKIIIVSKNIWCFHGTSTSSTRNQCVCYHYYWCKWRAYYALTQRYYGFW